MPVAGESLLGKCVRWSSSAMIIAALTLPLILGLLTWQYVSPFVAKCVEYGAHEIGIGVATFMGFGAFLVAWNGYLKTGETFQKHIAGGFLVFTLLYLPHGVLTRTADHNIMLFLLFGPFSRLGMIAYFSFAVLKPSAIETPTRNSSRRYMAQIMMVSLGLGLLSAWLAYTPIAKLVALRLSVEGISTALAVAVIVKLIRHRAQSYLMSYLAAAMYLFIQSMVVFALAKPWDVVWWFAHGIFASGFMVITFACLTAYRVHGTFSGSIGLIQSLSQLIHRNEELVRTKAALELATENRKALLSNISHDVRTPLNSILGLINSLQSDKDPNRASQKIKDLHLTSRSLLTLIDDFLEFNRIESQGIEIKPQPFHIGQFVDEIRSVIGPLFSDPDVRFVVDCDEKTAQQWIVADQPKLGRMAINLLSNAVKFTEKGEVRWSIWVNQNAQNDQQTTLGMQVVDTGLGMSDNALQKIFQRFNSEDRSGQSNIKGTGLGLTIIQQFVQAMNGEIECTRNQPQGTRFELRIPVAKHQPRDISASIEKPLNSSSGLPSLQGFHVLVVDDSRINRVITSEILTQRGATVQEAATGAQALQMVLSSPPDEQPYDVILMDLEMPEMDGLTAALRIRQSSDHTDLPIIAVSGVDLDLIEHRLTELRIQGYVLKPIDMNQLISEIIRVTTHTKQPEIIRMD